MGDGALRADPAFRATLDRFDGYIRGAAGWSVADLLRARPGDERWERPAFVQPALVAVEVALAALWDARGVRPGAVVGQSVGEVAAACVAGALTEADAARVACALGAACEAGRPGTILLVGLSAAQAGELCAAQDAVFLAGRLSPHVSLLAGEKPALEAVRERLRRAGVYAEPVRARAAAHSPLAAPGQGAMRTALGDLRPVRAHVPLWSTRSGERVAGGELGPEHWTALLVEPVALLEALDEIMASGSATFLEVSPAAALEIPLEEVAAARAGSRVLVTQRRGSDGVLAETESQLRALGYGARAPLATAPPEPLAIIGMACRLPGGIDGPDAFWDVLQSGREVIGPIPESRWDADALYDPTPGTPGKMYVRRGGFLHGVDAFDSSFFQISPREARSMDPQQRLLLEVTWEALEHAGIAPDGLDGEPVGVFTGVAPSEHQQLMTEAGPESVGPYMLPGTTASVASGRVAYVLGTQGPALSVDTACSASLTALHLAARSLRAGEVDLALVGGVNVMLAPDGLIVRSQSRMLSPRGRCSTFDAAADGYVQSEGCGVLVLKRLSDAERDGDRIVALVRATATNQDGRSAGLMAPRASAQTALLRAALEQAHLGPDDVQVIEAHGTGTPIGDPIELEALQSVFGGRSADPLLLGTAKANVGHCEAAAGVVGLIKAALSLQHGQVPPHPHFEMPTPAFDWEAGRLAVPTRLAPWPGSGPRRVGVSGFGVSGTNVHAILEQAPAAPRKPNGGVPAAGPHVLALSARTPAALVASAERHAALLAAAPAADWAGICATAARGRAHFAHRLGVVAEAPGEAADALRSFAAGRRSGVVVSPEAGGAAAPSVAFLFTGQGAQHAGMGRALYRREPVFRNALDTCAAHAAPLLERPLLEVMFGDDPALHETAYTQPALFAFEYALAALWRAWGIVPSAVMGHSVGEYVAACVAGVFSVGDAMRLVVERGRLMQALPAGGRMAAVLAPAAEVRAAVDRAAGVSVAGVNGPEHVVVSGDGDAVDALCTALEATGAVVRPLRVSHAFHSARMEPMLAAFEAAASRVAFSEPTVPLVSNVTGRVVAAGDLTAPGYWARHVREPVEFQRGMESLVALGVQAFVEVGPHPTLTGMGRACVPDAVAAWIPSAERGVSELVAVRRALAALYVHGAGVDWEAAAPPGGRLSLPTYPFERRSYPLPARLLSGASASAFSVGQPAAHPLLGRALASPVLEGPLFESRWSLPLLPYTADHQIFEVPVFPGAGFLEMAHAAALIAFDGRPVEVSRVTIKKPFAFVGDAVQSVQVALVPAGEQTFTLRIFSRASGSGEPWREHVVGSVAVDARPLPPARSAFVGLPEEAGAVESYYARIRKGGTRLRGPFVNLERLLKTESSAAIIGHVRLPDTLPIGGYGAHPVLVDGALQVLCSLIPDLGYTAVTHVPVSVKRYRLFQTGCTEVWCEATAEGDETWGHVTGTVRAYDADGTPVFEVEDIELQRVDAGAVRDAVRPPASEWTYAVGWEAVDGPPAQAALGDGWLVVAQDEQDGHAFAESLRAAGATRVLTAPPPAHPAPDGSGPGVLQAALGDADAPLAGVLYVAAPAAPGAADHALDALEGLFHLLHALSERPAPLAVATRGAVVAAPGEGAAVPGQAAVWGFCRTARAEHPELRLRAFDLPAARGAEREAALVAAALAQAGDEPEVALRDGRLLRPRLRRHTADTWAWTDDAPYRLDIKQRGSLDQLALIPAARRAPGPGEAEIRVQATGLNFRDVLNALGMYPGDPGPLGGECAGRVTAVGAGVSHLSVGDEVVALANGAFQGYVTVPAPFAVRRPAVLSPAQGATLPITFLTAYHGLHRIARLQRGQRVLIHAAAGGVGMAAVQLALRAGAEVFGTAGDPQKRAAVRALGVEHVFDSRSTDFAAHIGALVGGGLDVVLNALTGPFIPAGLGLLRAGGYFLELGKREVWTPEQVEAVQPGVHYVPYDLGDVMRDAPADILDMLTAVADDVAEGHLKPLPVTAFAIREVHEAFRYMAQARHTGKVVVVHPPAIGPEDALVHADASYLITGGLGGLGLRLARRLASLGARHLVLVARRAPSADARAVLEALEAEGVAVRVAAADVSDADSVDALLADVQASMPPLRGVFHAAGVLEDALLVRQEWPQLARVLAPKLDGAHHLDRATQGLALDHFVLFSSIAAVLGPPGQGAYAAANASLDALAARRRAAGKPALSVNWGPWDEVGMAAALDPHYQAEMSRSGIDLISVEAGLDVLERLMREARADAGPAAVVVEPFAWRRMDAARSAPLLHTLIQEAHGRPLASPAPSGRADAGVARALELAPAEGRIQMVLEDLRARIGRVTGAPEDDIPTDQPLTAMGLESLMAVEFKSQVETAYGVSLTVAMLLRGASLDEVARYVLQERFGEAEDGSESERPEPEEHPEPKEHPELEVEAGPVGAERVETPGPPVLPSPPAASGVVPGAVPLQTEGGGIPLFLVPGAGGGAMQFYTLFRYLGTDRPAYALEPRRGEGENGIDITVPGLVAHALSALRSVQPSGPYALAGYSTGGIVAYEVAHELTRQGEEVALTCLLDTVNVWAVTKARFGLRRGLAAARDLGVRGIARQVQRTATAARGGTLEQPGGRYRPGDVPDRIARERLFALQRGAFLRHTPSRFSGRLVVFRTQDHPDYVPDDLGWGEAVKGGIDLHTLPGTHLELLGEPNAAAVAAALRPYLDALQPLDFSFQKP